MEIAANYIQNPNHKRDIYKQAGILHLRAVNLLMAEDCFRKSLDNAMAREKAALRMEIEQIHINEALNMEKSGKRAKAVEVYERMLRLNTDPILQRKIQERLLVLYEQLGRIQDHLDLRDRLARNR